MALLNRSADPFNHGIQFHRFFEILSDAGLILSRIGPGPIQTAKHDYWNFASRWLGMKDFADRKTVHIRKNQVEQDHVRQSGPGRVQGLHCIRRGEYFATLAFEIELEELHEFLIIVHDQYLWFHTPKLEYVDGISETNS